MNFEIRPKYIVSTVAQHFLPFIAFGILLAGYSFYDLNNLDVIGLPLILKHALDILSVGLLVWIVAGIGHLVLFHARMLPDDPLDALLFSIAIGFGIIANLLLLLGLAAALHALAIFFLFLFLLGIASHQGPYVSNLIRGSLIILLPPSGNRMFGFFCLLIFSLGAIFLLVFAMAPPVDWDSLMYHLQLPIKFVNENRIFLPADNLHVAFIGLAHMLYIPFLEIGSISGPALLSAFTAVLFGLSIFVLADRLFERNTAYINLAILWGTSTILLVATTPRVDVTLCFYLLLAQHALMTALYSNSKLRHRYFYLAAVLLGLSFGVKYPGLIYTACLCPVVAYVAFKNSQGLLDASKKILLFGATFLILMSPWLAKNWYLLEAPLFPYFDNNAQYSKYAPPWIKSISDAKPRLAAASVNRFQKNRSGRKPLNLLDLFLNPGRITIEGEGRYYYANMLFFLLPLGIFAARKKRLAWLVLPAILYIGLISIRFTRINIRYLLPAIAPFTIAAGYLTHSICRRISPPKIAFMVSILLIAFSLALTARVAVRFLDDTKAVKHAFGRISSAKYMQKYRIGGIRNLSFMLDYVNKDLPKDSVILMLFEARSIYFRTQAIQDIGNSNWPVLSNLMTPADCLQRLNVTHVLVNQGTINYYTKRGSNYSPTGLAALQGFTDRCLELVHETQAHRLYRVKNE